MKSLIVYHSETGNTKRVAEYIHEKTDSDILELKPEKKYSKIGMYTSGIKKALLQQRDEIGITNIDLSSYDIIIIGTPVWGGHPTPVANAGLGIIKGGEGKKAVAFATYRGSEGESLNILRKKLEDAGLNVLGAYGFSEKETEDSGKIDEMIEAVGL
jgi:flavodoxin